MLEFFRSILRLLYGSTKMASMKLVIVKNGGHNYGFWGEQGLLAIDFFDDNLKNSTIVK